MAENHGFFHFPLEAACKVIKLQISGGVFAATFDYNDAYFMLLQLP